MISLKCINTNTMHLDNDLSLLNVDFSFFNKAFFRLVFIFHTSHTDVVPSFSILVTMSIDFYFIISCSVGIVYSIKFNSMDQKHVIALNNNNNSIYYIIFHML